MILIMTIIVGILFFLYIKYNSNASYPETTDLRRALRVTEYDLNYSDKKANIIALLSKVEINDSRVVLIIPTKGFWETGASSSVQRTFRERINSINFKDFMNYEFGSNVTFSSPQVEKDRILIKGSKVNRNISLF